MDPDEDQDFLTTAEPWFWHDYARQLVCSANRLREWYEPLQQGEPAGDDLEFWYSSFAPMMLLYALAAENLLKAIRIAQGVATTVERKFNPQLKTHNLRKLAEDAAVPLSKGQKELLERFRDFIESGKYPVGTSAKNGLGARSFEHPTDLDQTFALLTLLEEGLYATGTPHNPRCDLRNLCRSTSHNPSETM